MRTPHRLHGAVAAIALVAALAGCAAAKIAADEPVRAGFTLSSPGLADNAMLTKPYAGKSAVNPNCVGDNLSPALESAYGIAPTVKALAEGEASTGSSNFVFGRNTPGAQAYLGPCPPKGAVQHYVHTLIATTVEPAALQPGLTKAELLEAIKGKTLAATSLVLRFAH